MSGEGKNISYKPSDGLSYDPVDPKYWDADALQKEIERAFEICHGCRMCFKYCDVFPDLFRLLDERYDGDVRKVTADDTQGLMASCFQCKLCEVQCPYTPRDGHEFQLDFPRLVHRYSAQKARNDGIPLRERLLGDPDGAAKMARATFGLANAMNKVSLHRVLFEKAVGIHRKKKLPIFEAETFDAWAQKNDHVLPPASDVEVVLYPTCFVNNNETSVGKDTLFVLEKNGIKTACAPGLKCCGMPAWEHGDLDRLRAQVRQTLDILEPYVDQGAKVVVLNPTCTMMARREWKELLEGDERIRAEKISAAVRDPGELLWSIRKEERFSTDFKSTPGEKVAYHAPCHLRAQGVGFKGRDLLRKIPGVTPQTVLECCGHDGTYGMKVETFEASGRIGERAFRDMAGADAEVWATECPLAATQFEQWAGKKALHPMTVLARAYREDGFEKKLESASEEVSS
ncbi:MAG: heterodisulfide reductase-related iron-sulfur binding cluster [Myxococcota bacterium]